MEQYCRDLSKELDQRCNGTDRWGGLSSCRGTGAGAGVRPEDRWERTTWRKWRPSKGNMPNTEFHPLAPWILSYQLPLYGRQKSGGWGKIDLLGISPEKVPVIIEVKAEKSKESPLAVVLEAVRYGIALRELWTCGLREQWANALQAFDEDAIRPESPLSENLKRCQLICAAASRILGKSRSATKKR